MLQDQVQKTLVKTVSPSSLCAHTSAHYILLYFSYTSKIVLFESSENIFVTKPEATFQSLSYLTFPKHSTLTFLKFLFSFITILFHQQQLFHILHGLTFNLNTQGTRISSLNLFSTLSHLITMYPLPADGASILRLHLILDFRANISNLLMDNFSLTGASNSECLKHHGSSKLFLTLVFSLSVSDATTHTNNRVRDLKGILIPSCSLSPLPSTVTFKKFSKPLVCLII